MRSQKCASIVADGRQRLLDDPRYRLKEREVREAAAKKYELELTTAGSLKRLVVLAKMRREVRREMETLAPKRGLYLHA